MSYRAIHLLATEHQLHRFADHAGGNDAENLWSGDESFGAKAAAEEWTADMDLVRGHSEQSGEAPLRHGKTLTRRIDGKHITVPLGHGRMWLDCVVVLGWRLVGTVDSLRSCRKTCFDIASMHFRRIS